MNLKKEIKSKVLHVCKYISDSAIIDGKKKCQNDSNNHTMRFVFTLKCISVTKKGDNRQRTTYLMFKPNVKPLNLDQLTSEICPNYHLAMLNMSFYVKCIRGMTNLQKGFKKIILYLNLELHLWSSTQQNSLV